MGVVGGAGRGARTFDRVPYCVEFFGCGVGRWFAAEAVDDEGVEVYHFFMVVVGFDDGLTGYASRERGDRCKDAGFRHDGLEYRVCSAQQNNYVRNILRECETAGVQESKKERQNCGGSDRKRAAGLAGNSRAQRKRKRKRKMMASKHGQRLARPTTYAD